MSLMNLERAPACELTLTRDDPVDIAADSPLPRGQWRDDDGLIDTARLRVVLTREGQEIATCTITCWTPGFVFQQTELEAPEQWDEALLTDGRVCVAAGHGGPKGFVSGLVWK